MFRILGCKYIVPYKKAPERLLKCSNTTPSVVRSYSSVPKKKSGHPILYTLGFTSLTVGGVVAYAKFDNNFRLWLEENLPGSDKFIEIVTEEKGVSISDVVVNKYETVKSGVETIKNDTLGKIEDLTGFKFDSESSPSSAKPPSTSAPLPTKPSLVDSIPPKVDTVVEERSDVKKLVEQPPSLVTKEKVNDPPKASTKSSSSSKVSSGAVDLKSFHDLDGKIRASVNLALSSFEDGVNLLGKFDTRVVQLIEEGVTNSAAWTELKKLKEETNRSIAKIEQNASDALKSIETLKSYIHDPKFEASPDEINSLRQNINAVIAQVHKAKFDFEAKKSLNNLTEKFWTKIQDEKRKHQEELSILFPDLESYEKDPVSKNFNLLLFYVSNKIQFYQKELAKLEMNYLKSLEAGKYQSGDEKEQHKINEIVRVELSKEKRALMEEFQKKALELEAAFEKDIRTQLKRQAEAHSDHLKEILSLKQAQVDNKLKREYQTQLLNEQDKYKKEVAVMLGRMTAFEEAFKKRAHADAAVHHSQALWTAAQSLVLKIKNSLSSDDVKPLRAEIDAIKNSAAKTDTFVETVCSAFPSEAFTRGVFSEQLLRERFLNVQDIAYRVALVPEDGGSLPLVFLSYLQSFFIIRGVAAISPEEIRDEPISKLNHLNTYEILERARYFVDRSDLLQAVKYMNLLKGGAKAVSQQWIKDAIVFLETDTAAKALLSHAASVSFVQ